MRNTYKNLKGLMAVIALSFAGFSLSSAQVNVTLQVDMSEEEATEAFVTGTFTDDGEGNWSIMEMTSGDDSDIFSIELTDLTPGELQTYYFLNANDWESRETVPEECWGGEWDDHRGFTVPEQDTTIGFVYASCETLGEATSISMKKTDSSPEIFPNPADNDLYINFSNADQTAEINLYSLSGHLVLNREKLAGQSLEKLNITHLPKGLYLVEIKTSENTEVHKIKIQ